MKVSPKEELLLARCARGQREALQELMEKFGQTIHGFLFLFTGGDPALSRALFVKTLRLYFQSIQPFDDDEPFLVHFFRHLMRVCIDLCRETTKGVKRTGLELRQEIVLEALMEVPWKQRFLVLLRDEARFSNEEISEVLRVPARGARSQLNAARLRFRAAVEAALEKERKST